MPLDCIQLILLLGNPAFVVFSTDQLFPSKIERPLLVAIFTMFPSISMSLIKLSAIPEFEV